ncbi:MAG: 50S ribosomal protein L4 [Deltaproteobacteria bacterium]|nr:MAG: 50S ribosomal protein L4 [Deltaproteobacteria bacterium]
MPVVDVYNLDRQKVGTFALSDDVFDVEVREHLFHEVVRAQLATRRGGNAKSKTRAEVKHTTKKLFKQKGTGRARQGMKSAPHWVGGGTAHGPNPRAYTIKVNKKVRRAALCAALSRRQQEGRLILIDQLGLAEVKTKLVAKLVDRFEAGRALMVDTDNDKLRLSTRNLADAHFLPVGELNVYDILRAHTVLMSTAAAEDLQARIG